MSRISTFNKFDSRQYFFSVYSALARSKEVSECLFSDNLRALWK